MTSPLSRCASSPKGDDGLCCGAALAGRPASGLRQLEKPRVIRSAMDH